MRIAMWSGPRNISTAMMRAFGARADCAVSDEPFYGAYLAATGLDHPMREEVIAAQPTDWRGVAAHLTGPLPGGRTLWYQKHMTHHMLPGFGRDWTDGVVNAFLIRDPHGGARVLCAQASGFHPRRDRPAGPGRAVRARRRPARQRAAGGRRRRRARRSARRARRAVRGLRRRLRRGDAGLAGGQARQ